MKLLTVVLLVATAVVAVTAAAAPPATGSASLPKYLQGKVPQPPLADVETRIIGGEAAAANKAPFLVSLSVSDVAYAHYCAGTIIGKEWVLTVAHSIKELITLNGSVIGLPVYAGLHDRSQLAEAQVRHIDYAYVHKDFDGHQGSDDIALLHVSPPFQFNAQVKPIVLPASKEQFSGEQSAIYGWGLDDNESTSYVKDLRVAKASVLNASECKTVLPIDAPVGRKEVCVKVAACYGDGGSPLVRESDGDIVEFVGVTSWGYVPCGYNQRPTVYTEVSQYIDWIAQVQFAYYTLS